MAIEKGHRVNVVGGVYSKFGNVVGSVVWTTRCKATVRLDRPINGKGVINILKTSLDVVAVTTIAAVQKEIAKREEVENKLVLANKQNTKNNYQLQRNQRALNKKDHVIQTLQAKLKEAEASKKSTKKRHNNEMSQQKIAHDSAMNGMKMHMEEELAKQKASYEAKNPREEEATKKRNSANNFPTTEADIEVAEERPSKRRKKNKKEYPLPSHAPEYDSIRDLLQKGGWQLKSQNGHYTYERPAFGDRNRQTFTFSKTPSGYYTPKNELARLKNVMEEK